MVQPLYYFETGMLQDLVLFNCPDANKSFNLVNVKATVPTSGRLKRRPDNLVKR